MEEPLEIRVGGTPLAVTMRTPGHDVDLAVGFLVSEGVIVRGEQVAAAIHCAGPDGENTYNVLDLTLAPGVPAPDASIQRSSYTTSSCGVCGKASIDAVRTRSAYPIEDDVRVDPALLVTFPDRLRAGQEVFEKTGGLHAAALFDGRTGEMLVLREDVGRHNAVDKVIGWAAREALLPLRGMVLQVSGRASFELDAEGVDGRHPGARCRVGALVARRRAREGGRPDPHRLPPRGLDGGLRRRGAHHRDRR